MFKIFLLISVIYSSALGEGNKQMQQTFDVTVTQEGFQPKTIKAKSASAVILKITRKTDATCATEIQIPSKNVKKNLPLNKTVSIELGVLEKGEISFGCGMNMMEAGVISVK